MSDEVTTQERLLKLLYRISKNNGWMPITDIITSVSGHNDFDMEILDDNELEKRLIKHYGTYIK